MVRISEICSCMDHPWIHSFRPLWSWVPPPRTQTSRRTLCCTFPTVVSGYKFLITAEGQLLGCYSWFHSHTSCLSSCRHCELTRTRWQWQQVACCYKPDVFVLVHNPTPIFLCVFSAYTAVWVRRRRTTSSEAHGAASINFKQAITWARGS